MDDREKKIIKAPEYGDIARWQIMELLKAWNVGDSVSISRVLNGLKFLVWPWLNDEGRAGTENIKFEPVTKEEAYTPEDRLLLAQYGALEDERDQEITSKVNLENQGRFTDAIISQWKIIGEACADLGVGFAEEGFFDEIGQGDIDWQDKKTPPKPK